MLKEALAVLRQMLGVKNVEINMRNTKFVEKIISERPEKEYQVLMPESKVEHYIASNEELRKLSYRTVFHKVYFEDLDATFPYPELTLEQIGIPPFDVIQVATARKLYYVELSGDASLFI